VNESEPVLGFILSRARFSPLALFLSLFSVSLGCVDGTKGCKIPKIFLLCKGQDRPSGVGGGGWEEGKQKNRRIRKESVADCFAPFLRKSFGLFSVDLSKGGVEEEIRASIRTRFCVVVRGCWLVVVVHRACRGWDKRGQLREI
jgi:hypothetical protein